MGEDGNPHEIFQRGQHVIPSCQAFDEPVGDYNRWFDEYGTVYAARLRMLLSGKIG